MVVANVSGGGSDRCCCPPSLLLLSVLLLLLLLLMLLRLVAAVDDDFPEILVVYMSVLVSVLLLVPVDVVDGDGGMMER